MQEFQFCLEEEKKVLNEIVIKAQDDIEGAAEGSLRIAQKDSPQYYWVNSETNKQGKYIRKSNEELARELAQKDYAIKSNEIAIKKLKILEKCSTIYEENNIVELYEIFCPARQQLIEPYILSDYAFEENWRRKQLDVKSKIEQELVSRRINDKYPLTSENGFMTERGELVRSKSEKIIADKLYMMNIPYSYEQPIFMEGVGYIYPDFTILNIRTREEIYWEHFGLMDEPEYSSKAIKKISTYERNHIYNGKNLITTFEISSQSLNTQVIENLIVQFLV